MATPKRPSQSSLRLDEIIAAMAMTATYSSQSQRPPPRTTKPGSGGARKARQSRPGWEQRRARHKPRRVRGPSIAPRRSYTTADLLAMAPRATSSYIALVGGRERRPKSASAPSKAPPPCTPAYGFTAPSQDSPHVVAPPPTKPAAAQTRFTAVYTPGSNGQG